MIRNNLLITVALFTISGELQANGYTATCYWGARINALGEPYDLIEQLSNHSCHPAKLDDVESAYTADCAIGYGQYGPVIGGVMSKAGDTTYFISTISCVKPPRPYRPWAEEQPPPPPTRSAESFFEGVYRSIYFSLNVAQIDESVKESLRELALFVRGAPATLVEVTGNTDSIGPSDHNLRLSESRAHAVASYLQWLGIHRNRMRIQGLGEGNPVADNRTEAGRGMNRRVDIKVIEHN